MKPLRLAMVVMASLPLLAADVSLAQSRGGRRERFNRDRPERDAPSQPSQTQPAGATTGPSSGRAMQDQFAVLLQRSIFAKSGVAAPVAGAATTSTAPTAPPLSPEQAVVFVGVLVEDGEYTAFAENQQTHQLMVLRRDDDVARGKVAGMTLDTLVYVSGGAVKVIHLGQNLAGELAPSSSFNATSTPGSSGATTPGPTPAGMTPEQAAVLERLRARARQQRGE